MRILHIDTGREMRGGQIQVKLLMKGLREAGHECQLLARPGSPLFESDPQAAPAGLVSVWSRSTDFDILHAHDARAHTLAAIAGRAPFVVSRRVAFPVKRGLPSKWKYARARRFLAVSRFVAKELQSAGVPTERIDVVYDAVDLPQPAATWDRNLPAVALATSDPQKGRTIVERAAHIAGIPIVFSNDLTRDLQRASMFVYITQSEGLGSAALLAMARGVPVVASRAGGLAEVFGDELAGLYVRNEPEDVARAMRKMRDDADFARSLIRAGQRRVAEQFTLQHMVEGTLKSYERAVAG